MCNCKLITQTKRNLIKENRTYPNPWIYLQRSRNPRIVTFNCNCVQYEASVRTRVFWAASAPSQISNPHIWPLHKEWGFPQDTRLLFTSDRTQETTRSPSNKISHHKSIRAISILQSSVPLGNVLFKFVSQSITLSSGHFDLWFYYKKAQV